MLKHHVGIKCIYKRRCQCNDRIRNFDVWLAMLFVVWTMLYTSGPGYFGPKTFRHGWQSTRHTVNSSHGQLVTQSTRHRSSRHPVDSSHGQLVTKRRSTRHKQTSWPFCRSSIITLTCSPRSPPLRKNAQEIEQKTKWTTKHAHVDPKFHLEEVVPHQPFFFSEN